MKNDAVTVAPHIHSVAFENEKLRVLKVVVKPGDKAEMHSHPENVVYVLKTGILKMTNPGQESRDLEFKEGQTFYTKGSEHTMENNSANTVEVIQIEFK